MISQLAMLTENRLYSLVIKLSNGLVVVPQLKRFAEKLTLAKFHYQEKLPCERKIKVRDHPAGNVYKVVKGLPMLRFCLEWTAYRLLLHTRKPTFSASNSTFSTYPVSLGHRSFCPAFCFLHHPFTYSSVKPHANDRCTLLSFPGKRFVHSDTSTEDLTRNPFLPESDSAGSSEILLEDKNLPSCRLKQLAKLFKCSEIKVKRLLVKFPFLKVLAPELIQEKLLILTSFGLTHAFIRNNARLLYHTSSAELHRRVQLLAEYSNLGSKSFLRHENLAYYLVCNATQFVQALKNVCAQRDALEGCPNQLAYIQFRLQCSDAELKMLMTTFPMYKPISNVKLKEQFDFLLNEVGLSPKFLIMHKRLMSFAIQRLRSRWERMKAEGITSEKTMFSIWCLSEKKYEKKYIAHQNQEI